MKVYHYIAIAIRLFAIWLFLYSISQLVYFVENIAYGTVQGIEASVLVSGFAYIPWLIVALLLWRFPLTLAKNIVPPEAEFKQESITPQAILSVLISAIALFLLYRSIMDGVYWLTFWKFAHSYPQMGIQISLNAENKASMVTTAIEFFVAVLLFFNCKNVAKIASKF